MKRVFIFTAFLALTLFLISCNKQPENILDMNLKEHKNLALHIHPKVEIEILGQEQIIPDGIGISNNMMRVIHTHDQPSVLHVESPVPHQFYLKDFFTIWGKRFTNECIFEYCADDNHELKVYVNGVESNLYGDIPLKDKDEIKIVYSEKIN